MRCHHCWFWVPESSSGAAELQPGMGNPKDEKEAWIFKKPTTVDIFSATLKPRDTMCRVSVWETENTKRKLGFPRRLRLWIKNISPLWNNENNHCLLVLFTGESSFPS